MKIGEHEYKGIKVWYDDHFELWECELDRDRNRMIQKKEIGELRKRIDEFVRKEKNFKRFEVIRLGTGFSSRSRRGEVLTVTSITDDGEYWTTDSEGTRNKLFGSQIAMNIPENMGTIKMAIEEGTHHEAKLAEIEKMVDALAIKPRV